MENTVADFASTCWNSQIFAWQAARSYRFAVSYWSKRCPYQTETSCM